MREHFKIITSYELNRPIRSKQDLPVAAMFDNGSGRNQQKKSSPLKPLGQMNRNMVGSIYRMSSLKIAHFVSIHYQT
jgi:hypothetical protein